MNTINELSFEAAYTELQEVIKQLESGEMTLEQSVTLYERGKRLYTHCQQTLDEAELKVKKLSDEGNVG